LPGVHALLLLRAFTRVYHLFGISLHADQPGLHQGSRYVLLPYREPLSLIITAILTPNPAGRRLADGTMLYGCTCNLSVDLTACDQDFDVSFTGVRGFSMY